MVCTWHVDIDWLKEGIIIKRIALTLIMVLLLTTACSSVKSLEGEISDINQNEIVVNCSDEVTKGNKGNGTSLGYECSVEISEETKFKDKEGKPLEFKDFSQSDIIQVTFTKPRPIKKKNRKFNAAEIVLLEDK